MKTVYKNGLIKCSILTPGEAEKYRNMPVGLYQSADVVRSVAVKDGIKQILELTAYGLSRTQVKMERDETG